MKTKAEEGRRRRAAYGERRKLPVLGILILAGGCATTGATLGSGVGEKLLEKPPYYAGTRDAAESGRVAHLPIVYRPGGSQEAFFEPKGGSGTAVAALLQEMNAYLESLGVSARLADNAVPVSDAPDVRFGCEPDPFGECPSESDDIGVAGKPWMKLAVARPSRSWTNALAAALNEADAVHALVIELEVGQYWTHQRNLRGDKEIRLGTGHTDRVPWLTSLDQPVQVLQLTGALVDRDGRAVRIGAEGLLARPAPVLASGFGWQALVRDEDVEQVRTASRDDLPGQPLVWKVALRNLVAELSGLGLQVDQ